MFMQAAQLTGTHINDGVAIARGTLPCCSCIDQRNIQINYQGLTSLLLLQLPGDCSMLMVQLPGAGSVQLLFKLQGDHFHSAVATARESHRYSCCNCQGLTFMQQLHLPGAHIRDGVATAMDPTPCRYCYCREPFPCCCCNCKRLTTLNLLLC